MSTVFATAPSLRSPCWRIGLRGCAHHVRLQVGWVLFWYLWWRTRHELVALAKQAGFDVLGVSRFKYSNVREHGYTFVIYIGQSSLIFHGYPEKFWVTVDVVTCGDYEYCENATRSFARLLKEYYGAVEFDLVECDSLYSDS